MTRVGYNVFFFCHCDGSVTTDAIQMMWLITGLPRFARNDKGMTGLPRCTRNDKGIGLPRCARNDKGMTGLPHCARNDKGIGLPRYVCCDKRMTGLPRYARNDKGTGLPRCVCCDKGRGKKNPHDGDFYDCVVLHAPDSMVISTRRHAGSSAFLCVGGWHSVSPTP